MCKGFTMHPQLQETQVTGAGDPFTFNDSFSSWSVLTTVAIVSSFDGEEMLAVAKSHTSYMSTNNH